VRAYHQRTKHMPERYSPGPGYLDWANQPDPFRRFSGARMVELPLVPSLAAELDGSLVLAVVGGPGLLNLVGRDPHYVDGIGNQVGEPLLRPSAP
jgi:hypothetical protein